MQTTTALLLMDYQNGICKPSGAVGGSGLAAEVERRGVLRKAAECLAAARAGGIPVIFVRVAFDEGYTLRTNRSKRFAGFEDRRLMLIGSAETEICAEIKPAPGEPVITKGCVNPFIGTALLEVLVGKRIGELYLGGVATNFVVESTARHAADSGFAVHVIEDICAGFNAEMHDFAIGKILPAFAEICAAQDFIGRASVKS